MKELLYAGIAAFIVALALVSAPFNFPSGSYVTIREGQSVTEVARELKNEQALRSTIAFRALVEFFGGSVRAGTYVLQKDSAVSLAYRLSRGDTGLHPIRITIPEGTSSREIALILSDNLPNFDADAFLRNAKQYEGYLFPDTYFIMPGAMHDEIIDMLRSTFDGRTEDIRRIAAERGISFPDVVILASLIEKEARQSDTRKLVSGILWKRLNNDMPLQVDAVFGYIFGTDTYSPSFADLEVDSPYNTYRNRGLPPTAINNPGLDALDAALNPTLSPYWFYLTGADGTMHYAQTFDEHIANRKYLR